MEEKTFIGKYKLARKSPDTKIRASSITELCVFSGEGVFGVGPSKSSFSGSNVFSNLRLPSFPSLLTLVVDDQLINTAQST